MRELNVAGVSACGAKMAVIGSDALVIAYEYKATESAVAKEAAARAQVQVREIQTPLSTTLSGASMYMYVPQRDF